MGRINKAECYCYNWALNSCLEVPKNLFKLDHPKSCILFLLLHFGADAKIAPETIEADINWEEVVYNSRSNYSPKMFRTISRKVFPTEITKMGWKLNPGIPENAIADLLELLSSDLQEPAWGLTPAVIRIKSWVPIPIGIAKGSLNQALSLI